MSSDLYAPHIWEGMLHTLTTPNHGLVLRVLIEKKCTPNIDTNHILSLFGVLNKHKKNFLMRQHCIIENKHLFERFANWDISMSTDCVNRMGKLENKFLLKFNP